MCFCKETILMMGHNIFMPPPRSGKGHIVLPLSIHIPTDISNGEGHIVLPLSVPTYIRKYVRHTS